MRKFQVKCLWDTTLFLVIATTLNVVWFSYNPAFRFWPWHPYLIVIVLVGLFYGLWEALAAVLLCNIFYTTYLAFAGVSIQSLWLSPDGRNLLSFLIAGLFFGEAGELYRRNLNRFRRETVERGEEIEQLKDQNEKVRQTNEELQHWMRFQNSQLLELHAVSDRLLSLDEAQILGSVLELTLKIIGAEKCSLYMLDQPNARFWRHSGLGEEREGKSNPPLIPWNKTPFRQMREHPQIISLRDVKDQDAVSSLQWCAAAPLILHNELHGVLLIEAMPLIRLTAYTLSNLAYLVDIVNQSLETASIHRSSMDSVLTNGLSAPVPAELFERRLNEEILISKRTNSTLSVLRFAIRDFGDFEKQLSPDVIGSLVGQITQIVTKYKRKTDTLCYEGNGMFSLLMPRTEPEKTYPFIYRTEEETSSVFVPTKGKDKLRFAFGVGGGNGLESGTAILAQAGHAMEASITEKEGSLN